jgi:apolipoprotein N-acyltransferase
VAIAPLLVLCAGAPARRGFALGWAFGAGFFGVLLLWISIVGWVGWGMLVALEACFVGVFGAAWAALGRRRGLLWWVVAAPALWVATEYARSIVPLGGFTWGQLSQSQSSLWTLRPASLGGGWLVGALVVVVDGALARAWVARRSPGGALSAATVAGAALLAPLAVPAAAPDGAPVRVAIAQGGVPTGFASLFDKELAIVRSHERLTRALAPARPDLVVWPESSVGLDIERTPAAAASVARAARAVGSPLIVGGNLDVGTDRYLVMAFLVSAEGDIVDRYQKTHLVPFGEYIPARPLLGWIPMLDQVPRDAIPGDRATLFDVAGGVVAPVISFEGDFGSLVRARIDAGGRLLVVATNTSTWGDSWASEQHLAFSRVRAVENGVWVVHAAISGTSAFVSPAGDVRGQTPVGERASAVATVRFATEPSFYARTGDWFPLLCGLVSIVSLVAARSRRATLG